MKVVLGLFAAAMCGYRAYQLYSVTPSTAGDWTWVGAWGAASLASLIVIL